MLLSGKAGIVTGAGQGIGQACAEMMASEGAAVLVVDVQADKAEDVASGIRRGGGRALAFAADLGIEATAKEMISACASNFGRFDFLHQNAAIQIEKLLHQTTNEDWDRLHLVNLKAAFWGSKHAVLRMMADGNGGSIINTASALSTSADPLLAAYTTMKHGLLGLTRAVAVTRDYARAGIRCNCVCPGDVLTPMVERYFAACDNPDAARDFVERQYPGGRIGRPSEIAEVVAFLASDKSSFINGAAIAVDGGLLAQCYSTTAA